MKLIPNREELVIPFVGGTMKPLEAMKRLYGGTLDASRRRPSRSFESSDGVIRAARNGEVVRVQFEDLDESFNVQRWVALQIFRSFRASWIKGNVALHNLIMQVPGTEANDEWHKYHNVYEGKPPQNAPFRTFAGRRSLKDSTPVAPSTIFHATGKDLPAAAFNMARGYKNLYYRDVDEEPYAAVADRLGVFNLDTLRYTWDTAMDERSDYAAARLMLQSIVDMPPEIPEL